jgi:hypothetical protein
MPAASQPDSGPGGPAASDAAALVELGLGIFVMKAISLGASLGLFDRLAAGPESSEALAAATGTDPVALRRLVRILASYGALREAEPDRFGLAPRGELLRADVPGSLANFVRMLDSLFVPLLPEAIESVRTGQPVFERVFGAPFFDFLTKEPEVSTVFSESMQDLSRQFIPSVIEAYDFSSFRTLVDVGGGHGSLLRAVLGACPQLRGVLFDLPPVADRARDLLASSDVADRCEAVGGDFFHSVPPGGDAYILSWIIHDWDEPAYPGKLPSSHGRRRSAAPCRSRTSFRLRAALRLGPRPPHACGTRRPGTGRGGVR